MAKRGREEDDEETESDEDDLQEDASEEQERAPASRDGPNPEQNVKVESILGARMLGGKLEMSVEAADEEDEEEEGAGEEREPKSVFYLVKWENYPHVYNEWVTKAKLESVSDRKLRNFNKKYDNPTDLRLDDSRWYEVEKLLARRKFQGEAAPSGGVVTEKEEAQPEYEWLVKWKALV